MSNRLEELILADRVDEAVSYVSKMNAAHIASLFDYDTMEETPEKYDRFIRRLYESAESPYQKGEIDYVFGGFYITSLCRLDSAEFTARDLSLNALSVLAKRMAKDIKLLDLFVDSPKSPVAQATQERLMGYAKQLREMSFQPTAEESEEHERRISKTRSGMEVGPADWLKMYRRNRFRHSSQEDET